MKDSIDNIPATIRAIMVRDGLNDIASFTIDEITYYSLGQTANGEQLPIGLPIIYHIEKGKAIQLQYDDAITLLSKLNDN